GDLDGIDVEIAHLAQHLVHPLLVDLVLEHHELESEDGHGGSPSGTTCGCMGGGTGAGADDGAPTVRGRPRRGRSGAGGELALGLDALVELGEVLLGRVVDQIDLATGPGRQLHAGGQAHAVDALGAVGDQRGAVVDVRGEVGQDVDVLLP